MKLLSDTQIRDLAHRAGVPEKAVLRLLGSVRVELKNKPSSPDKSVYDIGLRLVAKDSPELRALSNISELLAETLREYQLACPVVVGWVGRGDFDPSRVPERIGGGVLLHANRTAGRLRARVLRKSC